MSLELEAWSLESAICGAYLLLTVIFVPVKEIIYYARIGYISSYLEHAHYYYKQFKDVEASFKESKSILEKTEYPEYIKHRDIVIDGDRKYLSSFIFFSLFLEAYINDFAARRLGDTYTRKYLDKLDVISKWVVLPKIITGKQIDTSRKSFEALKSLVALRNKFVHHKTMEATFENVKNNKSLDEQINLDMLIKAIKDIFKQLDDNENTIDNHQFYISCLE